MPSFPAPPRAFASTPARRPVHARTGWLGCLALAGAGGLAAPASAPGQQLPPEVVELLEVKDSDLRKLADGEVFIRMPRTDGQDVNLFGAVYVDRPFQQVLDQLNQIVRTLLLGSDTPGGLLDPAAPPAPGWLEFPDADADALPRCTVGKCDVKLTAELTASLADMDGSGGRASAVRFMEQALLDLLERYRRDGHAGLMIYRDKPQPLSAPEGLDLLLERASFLANRDPGLYGLVTGTGPPPDGTVDVFYWALEDFSLKPTLTLNHVAGAVEAADPPTRATVVGKQLYAAHYYQSALRIVYVGQLDPNDQSVGTYVAMTSQGRFDAPLKRVERTMAERGLRREVRRTLEGMRDVLSGATP